MNEIRNKYFKLEGEILWDGIKQLHYELTEVNLKKKLREVGHEN